MDLIDKDDTMIFDADVPDDERQIIEESNNLFEVDNESSNINQHEKSEEPHSTSKQSNNGSTVVKGILRQKSSSFAGMESSILSKFTRPVVWWIFTILVCHICQVSSTQTVTLAVCVFGYQYLCNNDDHQVGNSINNDTTIRQIKGIMKRTTTTDDNSIESPQSRTRTRRVRFHPDHDRKIEEAKKGTKPRRLTRRKHTKQQQQQQQERPPNSTTTITKPSATTRSYNWNELNLEKLRQALAIPSQKPVPTFSNHQAEASNDYSDLRLGVTDGCQVSNLVETVAGVDGEKRQHVNAPLEEILLADEDYYGDSGEAETAYETAEITVDDILADDDDDDDESYCNFDDEEYNESNRSLARSSRDSLLLVPTTATTTTTAMDQEQEFSSGKMNTLPLLDECPTDEFDESNAWSEDDEDDDENVLGPNNIETPIKSTTTEVGDLRTKTFRGEHDSTNTNTPLPTNMKTGRSPLGLSNRNL
jgi:hypothetical protein